MLNHLVIIGRLTRDPELRRTNTGKGVCSFSIACDKPGKDNGASFLDCVAWEKTADFISNYFRKGSAIVLEGRVESRQYETKDNQKRTVVEIVASQAYFYGKKEVNPDSKHSGFIPKESAEPKNFDVINDWDDSLPF